MSGGWQDEPKTRSEAENELGNDIPTDIPSPARQQSVPPAVRADLKDHALNMGLVIGTLAIDGLFVVGVGALNWLVDEGIRELHLESLSATVFWWVQLLLAASTIGAVAIRTAADLLVMLTRAVRQVRRG